MINVCYYITGHGLGHATRSIELLRGLGKSKKFNLHVVSKVNKDFFTMGLSSIDSNSNRTAYDFKYREKCIDSGAVQIGVFKIDPLNTLRNYYEDIHCLRDKLINEEVEWLKQNKINLVLIDASPLACPAGKLAGAKVILVGNFTWDFCFREMLGMIKSRGASSEEEIKQFEEMVEQCSKDCSSLDYFLRLPGITPLPPGFPENKIIPGPLIARGIRNADIRSKFGIKQDQKILLIGFGGFTTSFELKDEYLPENWVCLVLGAKPEDMPSPRFQCLGLNEYVPDLIHSSDAVLGKIGYGYVSECIRAGTVLIYVPREDWPEEKFLVSLLCEEYPSGMKMSLEDFESGNWTYNILAAASKKNSWKVSEAHNSDLAVDKMVNICIDIMK